MRKYIRTVLFAVILSAAVLFSGCSEPQASESTVNFEAMDTYVTITVYGDESEAASEKAMDEILLLDSRLSAVTGGSKIYNLNQKKTATLSDDTVTLIKEALEISEATGGAFDITIYPIVKLWGFAGGDQHVPEQSEIDLALAGVGSDNVTIDENTGEVTLADDCEIDLGGIAKGYTGDMLMEIFEEAEVSGAVVSLGGNIVIYGDKPDGTAWNIAIEDPDNTSEYICSLSLAGGVSVVTSGGYERYFEENGVRYHHIMDPKTGYPADSDLLSVTIISKNGTQADALSTALFVMGREEAVSFWETNEEYEFDMVLMDSDRNVYITEGIEDACSEDDFNVLRK